ncbi:hypothetical protein ABGB16_01205 [Micromonospora sp. B11E3]|uniref:hypothetical protein n=1 Tax=Micromonospora sp. B11E3 TaxID=3153562 RepID=UPI00325E7522
MGRLFDGRKTLVIVSSGPRPDAIMENRGVAVQLDYRPARPGLRAGYRFDRFDLANMHDRYLT